MENQELLKLYLSLPGEQREKRFADTARTAEITGLSRRTIQFWIEVGAIKAISIGRKYRVDLDSLTAYLSVQLEKQNG
ncbi:MAG: helix-turn-helix domain-containing protein [Acidobacteriota bacterium]